MPINIPKVMAVCCNVQCRHTTQEPSLEINFAEKKILYICPECKSVCELSLEAVVNKLPKSRVR